MSFTNIQMLQKQLGTQFITSFNTAQPGVVEAQLIPQADRIITRHTGKQPPVNPEAAQDVQLALYAAWIVHYLMAPMQSLSDEQYRQRERAYDRAIAELAKYDSLTIDSTYVQPASEYVANKRVGELP